ncbi:MAG: ATP-binding protein [Coriobacteriales bacterium]|nr:ATP-binding protein [Coriobacteriales bacterium]
MERNPYTLVFGREPLQVIPRASMVTQVIETFCEEPPSQQVFLITGVRGSGKTVLMTEVSKQLDMHDEWVVVELNPERDMLRSLAANLSSRNSLAKLFQSAKINLSLFGFGLEVTGSVPISDIEVALDRMLASLRSHGKKLLVTVDEAASTPAMREFASAFQILVRKDLPIFLLMTGLFDNIRRLQDEKTLTFLYRAPRLDMRPLNIGTIASNYRKNLGLDGDEALRLAQMTKGYPFAFQVFGYFVWQNGSLNEQAIDECKQYLDDYAYEKIWSELSEGDRAVASAIARAPSSRVRDVREVAQMSTNQFNPYRDRLVKKGVVDGSTYGHVSFALPLFDRYVMEHS